MKKISIFLAIIAIAFFALVSCNPTGGTIVSPDDPIVKPVISDSVMVEVTISLPECATLTSTQLAIGNDIFTNGVFADYKASDKKIFSYTFKNEQAKALLSTKTMFSAMIEAWDCNHAPSVWTLIGGMKTIQLQKGLNKVLLEYRAGS